MHRIALRGVAKTLRLPARFIGGRRFPLPACGVHAPSAIRSLSVIPPLNPNGADATPDHTQTETHNGSIAHSPPNGSNSGGVGNGSTKNGWPSSRARKVRGQKSRDLAPVTIPGWFLDNNVKLKEDQKQWNTTPLDVVGLNVKGFLTKDELERSQQLGAEWHEKLEEAEKQYTEETGASREPSVDNAELKSYRLHASVHTEITACLSAGLSSRVENIDTFPGGKTHLRLYCPIDGAYSFLEKIVEHAAQEIGGADIVKIDAQDLAEMAGDYIKEGPDAAMNSLWSLAFDVQNALPRPPPPLPMSDQDEGYEEGEESGADDAEERDGRPPKYHTMTGLTAIPLASFPMGSSNDLTNLVDRMRKAFQGAPTPTSALGPGMGQQPPMNPGGNQMSVVPLNHFNRPADQAQQWNDLKLGALLEVLVDANLAKRMEPHNSSEVTNVASQPEQAPLGVPDVLIAPADSQQSSSETDGQAMMLQSGPESPQTILIIRGAAELSYTHQGRLILEKLVDIVQKKRKNGQRIVIAGISASSALTADFSHNSLMELQSHGQTSVFRTVVALPEGDKGAIFRDAPKETRATNLRNIHSMIQRLFKGSNEDVIQDLSAFTHELEKVGILSADASSTLESELLNFDEVHRIALTTLGFQSSATELSTARIVAMVIRTLEKADDARAELGHAEQQLQRPAPESSKAKSHTDARMKKLKNQCNRHERTLLKGVVHTENIRTTFDHVHAPPETIESLKNLTMLSLTRPEAFKYGVLATDKITGCLLYGPPGTGKTLLAKAVARESGATVLEISGSDVYDMYVGEGEKNVRAIFSLAKKLSPCVVFIDEADAILGSRGSGTTSRNSHREIINQFLREWDGMTDTNAFIMVATNRPFDLDDAALRRLPRRLLVDLPNEKDREAILRIHLADENVDSAVSLPDLATRTPLCSGSDLKNMCVAAALAAVKEENDAATKHNTEKEEEDPAFVFPERRTLQMRHFEKAMEEITSSVSEDMSSLGAIRKFDEKYGDKRGKKKRSVYGFGGVGGEKDAAKVRS